MDATKHPNIVTETVVLTESEFKRYPQVDKNVSLNCEFSYRKELINDKNGQAFLTACITGANKANDEIAFEISCTFAGKYRIDKEPNMEMQKFLDEYAPAHLFPYIREYINSISMRAGIPPVILPPLNILVLLKLDKKITKQD